MCRLCSELVHSYAIRNVEFSFSAFVIIAVASDTTVFSSLDRNYRLMNAPVNTMTMAYIIDNST
jgi:hypothetical protein